MTINLDDVFWKAPIQRTSEREKIALATVLSLWSERYRSQYDCFASVSVSKSENYKCPLSKVKGNGEVQGHCFHLCTSDARYF